MVVVTGPAGSGKSALAKTIVREYAQSHTCFSFRAEEFARSHIDDVLDSAITGKDIEALLGSQERVLMHVESLERLLEHGTRDAFYRFGRDSGEVSQRQTSIDMQRAFDSKRL